MKTRAQEQKRQNELRAKRRRDDPVYRERVNAQARAARAADPLRNEKLRARYAIPEVRDRARAAHKRWAAKPEARILVNARHRAFYARHKDEPEFRRYLQKYRRRDQIARLYGLSQERYDIMLKNQHGQCAICKRTKKLSIDHSHASGVVRGLVCARCNSWLAAIDAPGWLALAHAYLEKPGTKF